MTLVYPIPHGLYYTISCQWLLMPLGVDTQTHTHIPTREPKQFQETRHTRPKATRAWFENVKKTGQCLGTNISKRFPSILICEVVYI